MELALHLQRTNMSSASPVAVCSAIMGCCHAQEREWMCLPTDKADMLG